MENKATSIQLKVMAYDLSMEKARIENQLKQIHNAIPQAMKEEAEKKTEKKEEPLKPEKKDKPIEPKK